MPAQCRAPPRAPPIDHGGILVELRPALVGRLLAHAPDCRSNTSRASHLPSPATGGGAGSFVVTAWPSPSLQETRRPVPGSQSFQKWPEGRLAGLPSFRRSSVPASVLLKPRNSNLTGRTDGPRKGPLYLKLLHRVPGHAPPRSQRLAKRCQSCHIRFPVRICLTAAFAESSASQIGVARPPPTETTCRTNPDPREKRAPSRVTAWISARQTRHI